MKKKMHIIIMLLLLVPSGLWAQDDQSQQSEDFSNSQIEKAVRAYRDIAQLISKYNEQVQEASEEERYEIEEEVAQKMNDLVESHGLEVEEYNSILQKAEEDEEFRETIIKKLKGVLDDGGANGRTGEISPETVER